MISLEKTDSKEELDWDCDFGVYGQNISTLFLQIQEMGKTNVALGIQK